MYPKGVFEKYIAEIWENIGVLLKSTLTTKIIYTHSCHLALTSFLFKTVVIGWPNGEPSLPVYSVQSSVSNGLAGIKS